MSLTAKLDGKPVYLYFLAQGTHEEFQELLCAHAEKLSRAEIIARVREALKSLPEKIEVDYFNPGPDLFEQAIALCGFIRVDREVPLELWLKSIGPPTTKREWLEKSLDRFERETKEKA